MAFRLVNCAICENLEELYKCSKYSYIKNYLKDFYICNKCKHNKNNDKYIELIKIKNKYEFRKLNHDRVINKYPHAIINDKIYYCRNIDNNNKNFNELELKYLELLYSYEDV